MYALFTYRLQNLQLVRQSGREGRLKFSQYCQIHPDGYFELISRILSTEECMLSLNGNENIQIGRTLGQSARLKRTKYLGTVRSLRSVRYLRRQDYRAFRNWR